MSDYGYAPIKNLEQAKDAWESFFGRFFSAEIPTGVDVTFDPELRQFSPREDARAKYKHPGFPDKNTRKLPLDPARTLHSDDFDDFLHGNTVHIPQNISLNLAGLNAVEKALRAGNYEDPVLKKQDHTFYALWLFKQNKITRQQMTTILYRDQIPPEYPLTHTFAIFNNDGSFTEEALTLLLPTIIQNNYGNRFTKEESVRFLMLLRSAPKSEQVFFISKPNPHIIAPTRQIGNILKNNRSWYQTKYNGETYDLHFSFAVIEAIQITKHGSYGAAASRAKLGKVAIDAVKEAVEYNSRPTAISIKNSGVEATTQGIHEFEYTPMPVVTAHDVYHARVHNTIPPEFNMMLNHMKELISKHTKFKWSKLMWELVDREMTAFLHSSEPLNYKNGAAQYLKLIHKHHNEFIFKKFDPLQLSDEGFAIVWDMVNHSEVWKKLYKVDIDQLDDLYQGIISDVKAFKKHIGNEQQNSEILTLKYRMYLNTKPGEFKAICTLIDSLGDKLTNELRFAKNFTSSLKKEFKNVIFLKFHHLDKDILIDDKSIKHLIPILVNMRLEVLYKKDEPAVIDQQLNQVSKELKSTHLGSTFTKEKLDESVNAISSLTSKLDFLESCYETIIHSSNYTRRHATADALFSFFKNPLTASQRSHILLLKEKLNELVSNEKTKDNKEISWLLDHRESHLARCNTDRFTLNTSPTPSARNGG